MPKYKITESLKPSGLNNHFFGTNLTFDDYITTMRNLIVEVRPDLTTENADNIIVANSPFSWQPTTSNKITNGEQTMHFFRFKAI